MKTLVALNQISNDTAYLSDIKSDNQYEVSLSANEVEIYSDYLKEAENYEAPDEETGVLLIYNKKTHQLESADNESELF